MSDVGSRSPANEDEGRPHETSRTREIVDGTRPDILSGVPLDGSVDIEQDATARCLLAVRHVRPRLESGACRPQPPNLPVRSFTALGSWMAASGSLLWVATHTGWVLAWLAFALTSLMPALMLMVIAQTAEPTTARLMHDRDTDP